MLACEFAALGHASRDIYREQTPGNSCAFCQSKRYMQRHCAVLEWSVASDLAIGYEVHTLAESTIHLERDRQMEPLDPTSLSRHMNGSGTKALHSRAGMGVCWCWC